MEIERAKSVELPVFFFLEKNTRDNSIKFNVFNSYTFSTYHVSCRQYTKGLHTL